MYISKKTMQMIKTRILYNVKYVKHDQIKTVDGTQVNHWPSAIPISKRWHCNPSFC